MRRKTMRKLEVAYDEDPRRGSAGWGSTGLA